MKKLTYNFINPNTDEETAAYVSEVLTKAIAKNIVYAEGVDKLIKPNKEPEPVKPCRKLPS